MQSLISLIICAMIVQYLTERGKVLLPISIQGKLAPFIALVFGLIISIASKTGLFQLLGIILDPIWVDYIVTGIAYSGGSVAFNELIKSISESRPSNKYY